MDNIQIELTTIQLNQKQAKQWIMMQFLDSIGFFDARLARVIIDFDKHGQIGNVAFTHNYKPTAEVLDKNIGQGV